jgi:integrase
MSLQLELPGVSRAGSLRHALDHLLAHGLECADATRAMHHTHARFLREWFGDAQLHVITYPEIRRYYLSEQKRGLSRESCRKRLSTLHMAMAEAVRMGWLDKIPPWVVIKTDSKPRNTFWTRTQWEAAHIACDDDELRTWVALGFWTGQHTSDLNRMRWCDVDLVRKVWTRRNTKSKAEPLELPLPDRLWAVLHERRELIQPHPRDIIAGRSMGHPNRPLREICHRADVPLISPIGLRHSCETFLAERGTAELFQTTWLGLKSPRMLWRHYRHVTGPTLEGGVAALNAR